MDIYLWIILILFVLIVVTQKKYICFVNPSIIFVLLWMMILGLANAKLFDLYEIENNASYIIILGIIFFLFGSFFAYIFKSIKFRHKGNKAISNVQLREKFLMILCAMCIVYYLPSFFNSVIRMTNGETLAMIRDAVQESGYQSHLNNFLSSFIILPVATSLEAISITELFFGAKSKKLFFLVIILTIIRTLGDGGRTPIFNIVLYLLACFSIKKMVFHMRKNKHAEVFKQQNKNYSKYKFIIIILVCVLVAFTISRNVSKIYRLLYFYFSMSPVLLGQWIGKINDMGYIGLGAVSLNGIIYTIGYFLKNISGTQYIPFIINAYNLIAQTDSTWLKIAPTTTANAYVSSFMFFYADGRILGIIVFSMIYGFFVSKCFYRVLYTKSCRNISVYLLLFQGIFFSFIRFPFIKAYYVLALFFTAFIAYKSEYTPAKNKKL